MAKPIPSLAFEPTSLGFSSSVRLAGLSYCNKSLLYIHTYSLSLVPLESPKYINLISMCLCMYVYHMYAGI